VQGNGHGTAGHGNDSRELAELTAARRRFVVPALIVFAVFYGGFLICVGYAQSFMATRVIGAFTWAYIWAFALILMTWVIALSYLRYSDRTLAPLTERVVERGPVPAARERVR
jgi:uncharacterized membrane protein (DUF485 family)